MVTYTLEPQLGREEFVDVYGTCRRTESQRFHAEISNRDYEWYLRGV